MIEEEPSFAPTFKYSHSEHTRNITSYTPITTNNHREDIYQNTPDHNIKFDPSTMINKRTYEFSKSPVKGPSYENLSERRKRLVKEFKNLNHAN